MPERRSAKPLGVLEGGDEENGGAGTASRGCAAALGDSEDTFSCPPGRGEAGSGAASSSRRRKKEEKGRGADEDDDDHMPLHLRLPFVVIIIIIGSLIITELNFK